MAAEHVFYGQNGNGVSGDLNGATNQVATMVGVAGMGPLHISVNGNGSEESEEEIRERMHRRFQKIGLRIMNRTRGSADVHQDPIASILGDPFKRDIAATVLGQALLTAINFITANKEKIEAVAGALVEKKEIYGDDLVALLDRQHFVKPEIDWTKEESWAQI